MQVLKGIQPGTEKRLLLSKTCREKGMSVSILAKITEPMRGKTDPEKEQLAEELIRKVEAGEIPLK